MAVPRNATPRRQAQGGRCDVDQSLLSCSPLLGVVLSRIPTANQPPSVATVALPPLRIRSIGLTQGTGGVGTSMSSMRKSPVRESVTDRAGVLNCDAVLVLSQMSVAATKLFVVRPALFVLPNTRPLPTTVMRPFARTVAARPSMAQMAPAGGTPRMLPLAAALTPTPPSKVASGRPSSEADRDVLQKAAS